MKAILYKKQNGSRQLILEEIEKPKPTANQVLIRIYYASINAADYRSMKLKMIPKHGIYGAAIAGIVVEAGNQINEFKPGDEVMGDLSDCGFGGFAEYAVAPENILVHKPKNVSWDQASAIPLAAPTALQALQKKGKVQQGHHVLIIGSAGGVGSFAVQLAKHFGTYVTAVCSTRNVEQTKSLGADHIIDYSKDDFTKIKQRFDLILAINGNYSLIACRRLLKLGGKYVVVGGSMSQIFKTMILGKFLSIGAKKMYFLAAKANKEDLQTVATLLEQDHIKAVIEEEYPLSKTAEAVEYVASGHAKAKVIIKVKEDEV